MKFAIGVIVILILSLSFRRAIVGWVNWTAGYFADWNIWLLVWCVLYVRENCKTIIQAYRPYPRDYG